MAQCDDLRKRKNISSHHLQEKIKEAEAFRFMSPSFKENKYLAKYKNSYDANEYTHAKETLNIELGEDSVEISDLSAISPRYQDEHNLNPLSNEDHARDQSVYSKSTMDELLSELRYTIDQVHKDTKNLDDFTNNVCATIQSKHNTFENKFRKIETNQFEIKEYLDKYAYRLDAIEKILKENNRFDHSSPPLTESPELFISRTQQESRKRKAWISFWITVGIVFSVILFYNGCNSCQKQFNASVS